MISKKQTFLVASIGIAVFFVSALPREVGICPQSDYSACLHWFELVAQTLTPILPLFVMSVIVFFCASEVYNSWFRFTRVWVPLSIVAVLLAPEYSQDWFYRIEKGNVAFVMSAAFVLISILIIAIKYFMLRRAK